MVYGNAQAYTNRTKFNKPGTIPLQYSTAIDEFPSATQSETALPSLPQNAQDHALKDTQTNLILAGSIKACSAALYESERGTLLLGDSHHPGRLQLTGRLGTLIALQPGQKVLDVASGKRTNATFLVKFEKKGYMNGLARSYTPFFGLSFHIIPNGPIVLVLGFNL